MRMNCWEMFFIQAYYKNNILNAEQQVIDTNPLYELSRTSRDLQRVP